MGEGEPVVVIQTALTADELRPLAQQMAHNGKYRVIHYHRRGYAGSGPVLRPASVAAEAADCRALLEAMDIAPAHVVGVSYSAAIALTQASWAPETVRTLTVVEAPPVVGPRAAPFLAANARLLESYRANGPLVALEELMTLLIGPHWRQQSDRDQRGSVAAMERDAVTFFESDLRALLSWNFTLKDAAGIRCPVLYIGGDRSGPLFTDVRATILRLLPHAEDTTVHGGGHLLASTHPADAAQLVIDFLRRHPQPGNHVNVCTPPTICSHRRSQDADADTGQRTSIEERPLKQPTRKPRRRSASRRRSSSELTPMKVGGGRR